MERFRCWWLLILVDSLLNSRCFLNWFLNEFCCDVMEGMRFGLFEYLFRFIVVSW